MKNSVLGVILAVVALILLSNTLFTVDMTEQAMILQYGRHLRTITEPGLYAKIPFIQQVTIYEKRVLSSDVPPGEYLTLDKKRVVTDPISRWRIQDPLQFFKTVSNEAGGLARLEPIILSELRDELATHDFADIISNQREAIMVTVTTKVQEKATEFGIEVIDVRIKRADLPDEVQASVFSRMQAERHRKALGYRAEGAEAAAKVRADADKSVTIIAAEAYEESQKLRGQGDAEAIAIYAKAFEQDAEFYSFLRSLEAYEKLFSRQSSMVMNADSDLFKYLNGSGLVPDADK